MTHTDDTTRPTDDAGTGAGLENDLETGLDTDRGPAPVEVRRNGALAAGVAAVAALVAAAYLARAASTGGWLDWAVFAVMGALALAYARSWLDARTPLLVADATGIRMRLGRTWHGLPWEDLEEVEHAPRQGLLRDGRLVAFPVDPEAALAMLDAVARRQAMVAQRVHGAPFALPLGLTTRVTGAEEGLTQALLALAPDAQLVVEVVPGADDAAEDPGAADYWPPTPTDHVPESAESAETDGLVDQDDQVAQVAQEDPDDLGNPDSPDDQDTGAIVGLDVDLEAEESGEDVDATAVRPHPLRRAAVATRVALVARNERLAAVRERSREQAREQAREQVRAQESESAPVDVSQVEDTAVRPGPLVATNTPSPLREPSRAVRSDVTRQAPKLGSQIGVPTMLEGAEPSRPAADHVDAAAQVSWVAVAPDDTGVWRSTTVVIDELAGPAHDPVIGPQLVDAREALGLGVEQLSARTRIRAHVIEAIEVDDFAPCGGDFYARGHLRTLARVLNLDAPPLLATYDETYAAAPIEARRVFEAELSTGAGGSIRSLRGGPNWSVIVAAVMAVVLAWSIARLVMDQPQDSAGDSPSLSSGSAGLTSGTTDLPPAVPVVLSAVGGGAKVVVRDGTGEVLFKGDLAFGQSRTVKVSPPIRVQTSDGSLTVGVDGQDPSPMGQTGRSARDTFVP